MTSQPVAGKRIVRLVVSVLISGPGGEESVRAKVDTGADRTTVSNELAKRLKLSPTGSMVTVKVSAGSQKVERPLVEATITLKGKPFRLRVGVADRSLMRYGVIIGRDILRSGDFLIDPSRKKPA
ncbi:MAG TPA: aspartyl protease family protein [Nitrososphaerales archaeon]|nr:aspartyl protease family protein [Nitrososphaerales archaeon]